MSSEDAQEQSIRMMAKDIQKAIEDPDSKEASVFTDASFDSVRAFNNRERNRDNEIKRLGKILGGSPRNTGFGGLF